MTLSKYNAHTEPFFEELKLLKVKDIFDVQCMKFRYKFTNDLLPNFFRSMFRYNHKIHDSWFMKVMRLEVMTAFTYFLLEPVGLV